MTTPADSLPFIKAHGTQNDFVVLIDVDDELLNSGTFTEEFIAGLCDRRAGIGGDGLLRIGRSGADAQQGGDGPRWFMDYRNADGSIAEMCGNGIRVFAHVLVAEGLETASKFDVDTRAGVKTIAVHSADARDAVVSVGMGRVEVTGVSTAATGEFAFAGLGIDVGNPHLAAVIPGLSAEELAAMEFSQPTFDPEFFPEGVNVEVLTPLISENHADGAGGDVSMRVWERGVGETRSCGTGTVAAARVALADAGIENGTVSVHVPGGTIEVSITDDEATMTGPSRIVARGELVL